MASSHFPLISIFFGFFRNPRVLSCRLTPAGSVRSITVTPSGFRLVGRFSLDPFWRFIFRPASSQFCIIRLAFLLEGLNSLPGFWAGVMDCQPVTPVPEGQVPAKIAPEIQLLLGV